MNNYRLLINPFAELDLLEAYEWYELKQENLGKRFIKEVNYIIEHIKENPFQFPEIKKDIRQAIVNNFPFVIFFYLKDDLINVFAIFHSSRNPIIWKKRFNKNF